MTEILFIKTSSLGDVLHHMPALIDARRHLPEAHFGWVVEEPYAPLARLHPAVDKVIPVNTRRWRRAFLKAETHREMDEFSRAIGARRYDKVIDTQGLIRTGFISALAAGERHGYDIASSRERWAALFYHVRHPVSRALHAIERNRLLTGLALGYQPEGALEYGLERTRFAPLTLRPHVVMLHASAESEKLWPEDRWIAVSRALVQAGIGVVLPWGTDDEHERSKRIAAAAWDCRVPDRKPLDEVARLIAGSTMVVGVDTGILHLAAALGVPLVGIFVKSEPGLTGPVGSGPIEIVGAKHFPPDVASVMAAIHRVMPVPARGA